MSVLHRGVLGDKIQEIVFGLFGRGVDTASTWLACGREFPDSVSLEGSNGGEKERVSQNDPTGGPGACAHAAPTLCESCAHAAGEMLRSQRGSLPFMVSGCNKFKKATGEISIP